MSGWKTTSLFGTIINYLMYQCASKLGQCPKYSYLAAQGDDLDVSYDKDFDTSKLYKAYEKL